MSNYNLSYPNERDTKGLYYLHPTNFSKKLKLISLWRKLFVTSIGNYELSCPTIVPTCVLQKSGHLKQFQGELFKIEGKQLYLRPETAQSIFPLFKPLSYDLAFTGPENSLGLAQVGRAFRWEKSTRQGAKRKREFEQLELEVMHQPDKQERLLRFYKQRVETLMATLAIKFDWVEPTQKAHYSKATIDLIVKTEKGQWQLGCINLRGKHDLEPYMGNKVQWEILEISLGLDRILDNINHDFTT